MSYPANCKYAMLITSLPAHKNDMFEDQQVPISRIQLDKKLALLTENDARDLSKIEGLLHWSHIKTELDQIFVDQTIKSIATLDNQFIKNIIIWRLELRIILAALRLRQQGQSKPPEKNIFGFDYWYFIICNFWHDPAFGLGKQLPWLVKANELLQANKSLELEKLLFGVVWEHYRRLSLNHYFNFEAVIIYVLRWDIIFRWTNNDATQAKKRFNSLIDTGLKDIKIC